MDAEAGENEPGESFARNTWYSGYLASNLAGGLTTPLIPLFVTLYLGLNVFYVGITSATASAASVPALILWGQLSDRYRKRKIFIMIGFLGGFISLLPIVFAHSILPYILVLVAFQVVAMASVPVSTMILIENSSEDKWSGVMGKFNFVSSIGTVLGLASGTAFITFFSYLGSELLVYIYVISAFTYLVAAIIIFIVIPEPRRTVSRHALNNVHSVRIIERIRFFPSTVIHFIGYKEGRVKTSRELKFFLFCTFFLMFAFQLFFVAYPVFMIEKLGAGDFEIFLLYILNSSLGAVTYQLTGRISTRLGTRNMLALALAVRTIVFGTIGLATMMMNQSDFWIVVSLLVYGAIGSMWSFIGIAETTSVSAMSAKSLRGKAIGYYNSLNGVGQIFGGVLSGIISLYLGYSVDFILAAVLVIIGASMILRLTPGKNRAVQATATVNT